MAEFQSLTGTIHTVTTVDPTEDIQEVSIPHRYDSHLVTPLVPSFFPRFQSLTGTIHTPISLRWKLLLSQFQSLTGTIHTQNSVSYTVSSKFVSIPHRYDSHPVGYSVIQGITSFQSLTGTIHTETVAVALFFCFCVSIPHRYDSHKEGKFKMEVKQKCFNPSQVRFTRICCWQLKYII